MELSPKLVILRAQSKSQKYKKIYIIPCILSDHNILKLEIYNKNNSRKYANNGKLNRLLNDKWVTDKTK
jgi:hypothetical protein